MPTEKKFFNELADSWDEKETVTPEKYRRIIKESGMATGKTILDVGTGTGVLIPYILEITEPGSIIFAIDYTEKMIEKLKTKNFPANVHPVVMDVHKTDFADSFFDIVVINSCYPHFRDKKAALKEIYRIMQPHGICTICHPTGNKHVNNLHKNSHHIANHFLEDMPQLKKAVEAAGFRVLKGIDEKNFFLISFTK